MSKWLVYLHVEFGSLITKQSWVNIAPSQNKFVHPYWKGHERWNLEEPDLEESSTNARKDVIDVTAAGQEGGRSRNV